MKLRRQFSYANVMSTLAVFIALAGGSIAVAAVGRNTIGSPAVKNNSLKSADLKNKKGVEGIDVADGSLTGADVGDGSLGGADVGDGSLGGADVADGSLGGTDVTDGSLGSADVADGSLDGADVGDDGLTGADILESSLGQVPTAASASTAGSAQSADTAGSAQTLNGVRVLPIKHRSGDVTNQTIFDAGGLQLFVTCSGGDEELRARATVAGGEIAAISDDAVAADGSAAQLVHNLDNDFNPGDDFDLQDTATAADDRIFQVQYLGGDGSIVSAHLIADNDLGSSNCIVSGYAVVIG